MDVASHFRGEFEKQAVTLSLCLRKNGIPRLVRNHIVFCLFPICRCCGLRHEYKTNPCHFAGFLTKIQSNYQCYYQDHTRKSYRALQLCKTCQKAFTCPNCEYYSASRSDYLSNIKWDEHGVRETECLKCFTKNYLKFS